MWLPRRNTTEPTLVAPLLISYFLLIRKASAAPALPWIKMGAVYAVSAFADSTDQVTVIMNTPRGFSAAYDCHFRSRRNSTFVSATPLAIVARIGNNEPFLSFEASVGVCILQNRTRGAIHLTLAPHGENLALEGPWIRVSFSGSHPAERLAVCTSPIHTDAYAASYVQWMELQRLVGVSQVFTYAFNPGPLLEPLMRHYEQQGFLRNFEWIIPRSILKNKEQQCLLPFFHPSRARDKYDSPPCTYHQDNYDTPWWGQNLALNDCLYRARGRYRFVAIIDTDEFILPRLHLSIPDLLSSIPPHAEYRIDSWKVCYHQDTGGYAHSLWPMALETHETLGKSIVDPSRVLAAGVHFSTALRAGETSTRVSEQLAFKLHDRCHDIHIQHTFATKLLPRLALLLKGIVPAALEATCNGGAVMTSPHPLGPWKEALQAVVNVTFLDLLKAGSLLVWTTANETMLNVYGGSRIPWVPWSP